MGSRLIFFLANRSFVNLQSVNGHETTESMSLLDNLLEGASYPQCPNFILRCMTLII